MKRSAKILDITASALFAAGLILIICALLCVRFDITKITTESEKVKMKQDITIGNKELYIKDSVQNIRIIESSDSNAHFVYYDDKYSKYTLSQSEDKVSLIRSFNKRKWYKYLTFSFDFSDSTVEVQLPAGYGGKISVYSTTGKIDVYGISTSNKITIDNTTGEILLRGGAFQDADIKNTTGVIKLDDVGAAALTVKNTTGGVALDNVRADCADINTSTGGIRFTGADFKEAALKATTGSIKGTLCGKREEYTITASSSTGSVNAGQNQDLHARPVTIKTSTGNITVDCD